MGIEKISNSKGFKLFMSRLYGWGAAVVILGALFKLMHWPGAVAMLTVWLVTEAIIFFFSAFEKPKEEYDWSLVYPELAYMSGDRPKTPTQELDKMFESAKVDGALIKSLGEGLRSFKTEISKINKVVDVVASTSDYTKELKKATQKMMEMNAHYDKQTTSLQNMADAVDSSETFKNELAQLTANLRDLNKVYGNMLTAMNADNKRRR